MHMTSENEDSNYGSPNDIVVKSCSVRYSNMSVLVRSRSTGKCFGIAMRSCKILTES